MALNKSILFVDAYDSFSQNILALLNQELGAETILIHIDTDINERFGLGLEEFLAQFAAIVLGPGPGDPNNSCDIGILYDLLDTAANLHVPVLGICLGFQVLCVKYGLQIKRMKQPCHGQSKKILYCPSDEDLLEDKDIFEGLDLDDLWATCYNSLGLLQQDSYHPLGHSRPASPDRKSSFSSTSSNVALPDGAICRVLAVDISGNVMVIRHHQLPLWGLQFHPESCKSNAACRQLITNWWRSAQEANKLRASTIDRIPYPGCKARRLGRPQMAVQYKRATETRQKFISSATEAVIAGLMDASASTGNRVYWAKVNDCCSRAQLSDFIYDLCRHNSIAMLESTKKGRFSIYSASSDSWQVLYKKSQLSVISGNSGTLLELPTNREAVWNGLEHLLRQKRACGGSDSVPFWGGFIGHLSYEHGLDMLGVDAESSMDRNVPEISLLWVERSIVYDGLNGDVYIQSIRKDDWDFVNDMKAQICVSKTNWTGALSDSAQTHLNLQTILDKARFKLPNREDYLAQFDKCQSELHSGNSYELCLTTETTIIIPDPAKDGCYDFELYKNLHAHNPVPFGAFLRLAETTVLSTSPEQYLLWSRSGVIDMIPMKGTVKRSADMTFAKASHILSSAKESAENLMIADLIRHDLYNTVGHESKVEVVKLCEVVEHETVYQLVSHIRAHSPTIVDSNEDEKQQQAIHYGLKALRQTLPPGSMTGAPKKRSCEILSRLEQRNRGIYSGVLGYMDVGGGGDWSVCIRTAYRSDNDDDDAKQQDVWRLGAGGAITVLSDAEGEWQEMMVKLNSVLQGFKMVPKQN